MSGIHAEPSRRLDALPEAAPTPDQLMRALAHPVRRRILRRLHEAEEARSPRELALALGCDLSNVGYHVGVLREIEVVALTDAVPKAGSTEDFYASTVAGDGGLLLVLVATEKHDEGPGPVG